MGGLRLGQESEELRWRYVYYKSASGRVPVREFIEAQDVKVREKIFANLERLIQENVRLGPPFASKLAGRDFWELRTKAPGGGAGGDIYRTFYFAFTGRKFVLLHAFQKKSQKTPRVDLKLAEERMKDYVERSEKRRSKKGKG
jgi:phage-related protein